ncbi:MAG: hypothetical protein EZS28_047303 [Streblomastix strix]|uniref:Uncharacterized protein n=1 Tax=Streblomastix strix TaxID=222440 RepID=A0A5J4THX8_9EUKA|nr:MAG: hypothetical protein EZS28_047303 [Streblomastix strix]
MEPIKNGELEFQSEVEFIRKYHKNLIEQHLSDLHVEHRPMKDIHLEASKFPGDVGACKVLKKTLNVV